MSLRSVRRPDRPRCKGLEREDQRHRCRRQGTALFAANGRGRNVESCGASCPGRVRLTGRSVLSRHLVHLLQSLSPRIARSPIAAVRRQRRLDCGFTGGRTSFNDASAEDARFPVLIDHGGKVAEQFGLTFEMDDAAKNVLKNSGLDLEKRNADGRWILPVPGTFVIDRSGSVAYAHVDADYRTRPEPQEIVAMCRSLRS
jgi:AhpC/TSA family